MDDRAKINMMVIDWCAKFDAAILPANTHAVRLKQLSQRAIWNMENVPPPLDYQALASVHLELLEIVSELYDALGDAGADMEAFGEIIKGLIEVQRLLSQ